MAKRCIVVWEAKSYDYVYTRTVDGSRKWVILMDDDAGHKFSRKEADIFVSDLQKEFPNNKYLILKV